MLAYFFPPMAASGSQRPAAFCSYLQANGYRPHVVTAYPDQVHPPIETDDSSIALLPLDLEVSRVRYFDRRQFFYRWLRREGGKVSSESLADGSAPVLLAAQKAPPGHKRSATMRYLLDKLFMFPDQQKDWARAVYRVLLKRYELDPPDVVYATGSPWSCLLAGARLARRLGVPFVADFRDPWSGNLKASLAPRFAVQARRLEDDVLRSATRVIANTEPLRQRFAARFPCFDQRFVTLTNGITELSSETRGSGDDEPQKTAAFELHYFGTVSKQRAPKELLSAWEKLSTERNLGPADIKLVFTGSWARMAPEVLAQLQRLEARGIVERRPAVPREECLKRMACADHLLILQQGYPMQIPAKIYEYMATQRPVIVIGGEGATADLMRSCGFGSNCPNDAEAIFSLLEKHITGAIPVAAASEATLEVFHYESLTSRLAQIFDDAISDYSAK